MSVKVFANMSPGTFFKKIFPAAAFAFTSTSSVASLPVTKECCDEMGVHSEISSFVLPLGATINMDGTAKRAVHKAGRRMKKEKQCAVSVTKPMLYCKHINERR